jgi:prepilin signal peptidase PulO-like enzyme (type II secretory pathway)
MDILLGIYTFVIGTAFGSFALAMTDRMKAKKDWVRGRSECDSCKHRLEPKDLVPIISWLSTGGKCRYCNARLSKAYPLAELACGLAFLLSYIFVPYELSGYGLAVFGLWLFGLVIMASLVVFDLRWFLLPNKLVYPLQITALIHWIIITTNNAIPLSKDLMNIGLTLLVSSGIFYLLHIFSSGRWIGDGDVRLGVAMGLFLSSPSVAWLAIFVASLSGVIIAIPSLVKSKKALKMKLPFGPMLIVGLVFTYLFGAQIIDWYSSTFLYL